ncbi:hypothetical protein BACI71_70039 [Bacillus mycoides]|uniref:Uncharacterized protein n=1 Tax=Bacillus mycoides TaxID=1405 RepID=A0A654AWX7_BACMY|nr:hypothetical protein BACI71_70039 [Bacillus mycoides]
MNFLVNILVNASKLMRALFETKRYFNREGNNDDSMGQASIHCIKVIILLQRGQF